MIGSSVISSSSTASSPSPGTANIDASCRWPVLTLLNGAAIWLLVSSIFGLFASLKFHKPELFSECAPMSYGRTYAVWAVALVYGFCIPSALAAALWILARLGQVKLKLGVLATAGAKVWHIAILLAVVGLLLGDTSGYEWFELPRYTTVILLGAFLLIAIPAFVTHANRTVRELQPAHWFLLSALFWFPWIFSTAVMLLHFFPVRGVAQAVIAWWFSGNLILVWLALSGLGITFYLLPKLATGPLQSRYNALFVFWTLALFGSLVGIQPGSPLPAWMPAVSGGATLMLIVPAMALAVCVIQTVRTSSVRVQDESYGYTRLGAMTLSVSLIFLAVTGIPQISRITDFTWYGHGNNLLRLYGYFAMTAFAAAYHVLPRVSGVQISNTVVKAHYWLAAAGSLLMSVPLIFGGVKQGLNLLRPEIEFLVAAKSALMAFRLATVGELLFLIGALLFCVTAMSLLIKTCCQTVRQACADESTVRGKEACA